MAVAQLIEGDCLGLALHAQQVGLESFPAYIHSEPMYVLSSALIPSEVGLSIDHGAVLQQSKADTAQKHFYNLIDDTPFCPLEVYGFNLQCHQFLFPL